MNSPHTVIHVLTDSYIDDLKLAASKMLGEKRRAFQAEIALKYCGGSARKAEKIFGWGRNTVRLGLHEKRTGITCLGAHEACCGRKLWEEKHPEVAVVLWKLAELDSQQDPTFNSTLLYTRLTAVEALKQLRNMGFPEKVLPSPSTMADVLNRNGYRLRPVIKAKPQKKIPETDAIFDNIKLKDGQSIDGGKTKRISMDCKATVDIGEYSRGGKTRGDNKAVDHDMGCKEKYTPFGVLDEDIGQLHIVFGSSAKTSDFIIDGLYDWWDCMPQEEHNEISLLQIKADNGPESSGRRTQFLKRIVEFADYIGKPIQLLYYPPYYSKYNPVERCWGILEKHWNGTKLVDVETMLGWAATMTWKGIHPIIKLTGEVYEKGVSLCKKAMKEVENRLERNPLLPKWDILIQPV